MAKAPFIFAIIAAVYILHHFFVDKPIGLNWGLYRFSSAAGALSVLLIYYFFGETLEKYLKIPAMIAFLCFCHFQAKTILWYSEVPYTYALVMVYVLTLTLQMNLMKSLLFSITALATQLPSFYEAGIDKAMIVSSIFVMLTIVIISRLSYLEQVKAFLAERRNEDAQIRLIEANKEYTDYVQKFLPLEVARRIRHLLSKGASVVQAVDEVLRSERRMVTALRCDIRNFTQKSKNSDYIDNSVLPEIKKATEVIDLSRGISRKIGDLVFAYYDFDDNDFNVLSAVQAGIHVFEENKKANLTGDDIVERQILISSGLATVGNIGDIGSSVEITALGTPINLIARMEDYVKIPSVKSQIATDYIFLDYETKFSLERNLTGLQIDTLSVNPEIGIKDYPEVEKIFLFKVNETNTRIISEALAPYQIDRDRSFEKNVTWKGNAA